MKLRVERGALAEALSVVGAAVPRRPSIPVLAGIRIRAEADSASVAGFDHEISSRSDIGGAEVAEPGTVLVSGRLLSEIAWALPAHPVELRANEARLEILCGQSRFDLPLMAVEDYPELPTLPASAGTVDCAALREAVAQVAVAAGRDDTLPMLTGINVEFHSAFLRLVSTDRFRIAIRDLPWQPATPLDDRSAGLLVPARAFTEIAKALSGPQIDIAACPNRTILGLRTGDQHHTLRTLDLPYAPYQRYLEDRRTATARLATAALLEAIKRVSLLSPRGTQIELTCSPTAIRLSAGDTTEGTAQETIPCEFEGDPVTVVFNPRYLLEGVTATHAESIELALNGPTRAATLRADHEDRPGLTYVLMPVRPPG
ncbi:DNA polymerase III subunit beta [Nocardia sp. NPDC004722]